MGFDSRSFMNGVQLYNNYLDQQNRAKEMEWKQQQQEQWLKEAEYKNQERANLEALRTAAIEEDKNAPTQFGTGLRTSRRYVEQEDPNWTGSRAARDAREANAPVHTSEVMLGSPEEWARESGTRQALIRSGSAADIHKLQQGWKNELAFKQGMALRKYLGELDDGQLGEHANEITSSERNAYKITPLKNGYVTVGIDDKNKVKMNREQMADWLSSRYVYNKTGDDTALKRMESIDKRLAEAAKESYDRALGMAGNNNTATHYANADANAAARLGFVDLGGRRTTTRELKPETVKRLNDLGAQIDAETDPVKKKALVSTYNREYGLAATEIGKVIPPRQDNTKGDEATKIELIKSGVATADNVDSVLAQIRGQAPDEVVTMWMEGKDLETGKPLNPTQRQMMLSKYPSLRSIGGPTAEPAGATPPPPPGLRVPTNAEAAYKEWQAAKGPWYLPTPRSSREAELERAYEEALRKQYQR